MGNGGIRMHESAGILPLFTACTKTWSRRWSAERNEGPLHRPSSQLAIHWGSQARNLSIECGDQSRSLVPTPILVDIIGTKLLV